MEMKGWEELGVVSTIYEEEDEEDDDESFNSLSHASSSCAMLTPSPPPPPPPQSSSSASYSFLRSMVKEWTRAYGSKPDVLVRVHDKCFHLHREALVKQSGYLRRHLTESSAVTVSPPSTMTAETFAELARFCYGGSVGLAPENISALRVAAGWLEMATRGGEEGLVRLAERYFAREVAADAGRTAAVLRSCVRFLAGPEEEAEAAAEVVARCAEALAEAEDGDGRWVEDVEALPAEMFGRVACAMRARLVDDHDLLYKMVDSYIHSHDGKLTEKEKTQICYNINCTKLSHPLLMHLVQNPRLPLRFVVQAMLVEQLHTRRCILDRATTSTKPRHHRRSGSRTDSSCCSRSFQTGGAEQQMTLGAILQRDAAQRRSADLRAAMEATGQRIRSLERDLAGLRQRLRWSEEKKAEMESVRSESFRIVRYQGGEMMEGAPPAVAEESCDGQATRGRRGLRRRLVLGLRSMFKKSEAAEEGKDCRADRGVDGGGGGGGDGEDVGEVEKTRPGHRRNCSFG